MGYVIIPHVFSSLLLPPFLLIYTVYIYLFLLEEKKVHPHDQSQCIPSRWRYPSLLCRKQAAYIRNTLKTIMVFQIGMMQEIKNNTEALKLFRVCTQMLCVSVYYCTSVTTSVIRPFHFLISFKVYY